MRIQELTLKNFRGFEDLTVTFPEGEGGLTVFVGLNGSGKTTVLEAIKKIFIEEILAFNEDVVEEVNRNYSQFPLPEEINFLSTGSNVHNYPKNKFYELGLNSRLGSKEVNLFTGFEFIENGFNLSTSNNFSKIVKKQPVFSYYSVERNLPKYLDFELEKEFKKTFKKRSNFNYQGLIFDGINKKIEFRNFVQWFEKMENLENEIRLHENSAFRDFKLNAIRDATLNFELGYSNPRISRKGERPELLVDKKGITISFDVLSHGEKLIFALVGDIIRHLSEAQIKKQKNPLLGKGIVLIDEIELHLHPDWQRKIIPALRRTFPNIQFIITTHSPQVISTCKKENVFILKDFQLQNTPHTQGRDSNSILQEIFGVEKRPAEFQREFDKLYRMMDDPESVDLTKHMLNDVEEKYGFYDQEVIRARSFFEDLNNK